MYRRNRNEKGSAIIESTLAMFVIFLVLGALLQLFYFAVGQMLTDYAALRGVRSHIVGFREYLVRRVVQVNAIGASGNIVQPILPKGDDTDPLYTEKSYINTYLVGWRFLEYENWFGATGHRMEAFKNGGKSVTFHHIVRSSGDLAKVRTTFADYALLLLGDCANCSGKQVIRSRYIPEEESAGSSSNLFFGNIDLAGEASMRDHAGTFLDLGGREE